MIGAEKVEKDHLTLKWGTLKAWHFHGESAAVLLRRYAEIGSSMSAMMQHDTQEQKEIICKLIDIGNFDVVYLDWDGVSVTKSEAKEYVQNYGKTL